MIPVDFTVNTEVAICQALEICDTKEVNIYLQHIYTPSISDHSIIKKSVAKKRLVAEMKLREWERCIKGYLPLANIFYEVSQHVSIEKGIIEKALKILPDLIVIGKKSSHSRLPFLNTVVPATVLHKTKCAVLTVKPGSIHNKIKKIVVPVTDHIPDSKMNVIASLCQKDSISVFLVMFKSDNNIPEQFSSSSLLKLYQQLRTLVYCQVEYAILHGSNKPKAILSFAEKNNADILLLNSESETRVGWPGRHISDVILPGSKVQVLSLVEPSFH